MAWEDSSPFYAPKFFRNSSFGMTRFSYYFCIAPHFYRESTNLLHVYKKY